jgi:hypothetical protein
LGLLTIITLDSPKDCLALNSTVDVPVLGFEYIMSFTVIEFLNH